jgi:hypothetical protein
MLTETPVLVLAFAAFWFGGAAIMSRVAGWHVLASLFPAPPRLQGTEVRYASARLGAEAFPISYRRCLRVVTNDDGLGLCLMFPFRFHSPPFFAPWSGVRACTEKQLFTDRKVTFHFTGTARQLTFGGVLGQELKARYAQATARRAAPDA